MSITLDIGNEKLFIFLFDAPDFGCSDARLHHGNYLPEKVNICFLETNARAEKNINLVGSNIRKYKNLEWNEDSRERLVVSIHQLSLNH